MEKIQSGPPLETNFWDDLNISLGNYILRYIRSNEDRVYMINGETKQQLRLFELAELGTNLAINLQTLGCAHDVTVAIYSENSIEFMIAFMGATLSGATVATFNYAYTLDELRHGVSLVKPKIIFCSRKNIIKAKEAQKIFPFIEHLIILDTSELSDNTTLRLSDFTKKSNKQLIETPYNENDTVTILFSSGTTGLPKGVMQSHRNILYTLKIIKLYNLFAFDGKIALSSLPMYHGYGMMVNLFTITLGQTLVFLKKYEEEFYLSLIEKYKIRSLYMVPPMVVFLLKTDLIHRYDISSVNHILCGAAPLKISAEIGIIQRLNLERVQQAYGMTECTLAVLIKLKGNNKPGTCGTVIPGYQGKVIDTETGLTLGPGQVGELCFKGPSIMNGYIHNAAATADTVRNGWLHTGDLGYYDDDGDFFIVDRLKELIKYNAFQVAPAELEGILINHPKVQDAGVIGIPDAIAGELPKAFVVKKSNATVTEKELQDYVASKVSSQKKLRGGVTFVDEIPKNPSGKILRRKLRELSSNSIKCKY